MCAVARRSGEALWPRAALLEYFELLTSLQDNMREYEELQVRTGPRLSLVAAKSAIRTVRLSASCYCAFQLTLCRGYRLWLRVCSSR